MAMRSRAGRNIDFIEAHCQVPEGRLMGEHMVCEVWQLESEYKIYNNDGKGSYLPEIEQQLDDRDAYALALAFVQAEEHGGDRRRRQFEKLRAQGRSWQSVAKLASYIEQCRNLELRQHETAPCWVIDPDAADGKDRDAAKLVRRMRVAGVSQYHPNPMAAIQAASAKRTAV
jgi:hypothetical protein